MRKILTILTLSAGLLAFPGTALAERGDDRASANHSDHRQQADRNRHGKDSHLDRKHADRKHSDEKLSDRKHSDKSYRHKKQHIKKYRAESRKQHKLERKHHNRIATYRHFNGNNYNQWRDRRNYPEHRVYTQRHREFYGRHNDRYRTHYLRYHRGHKRSHHQHDDNYLEWVTTMLLLNELLDDDYR
mgnify:CR=1 FL=1|tara:strand:- start:679 stop:1239 length:561 start_codon:yes stop_codon:yes gene_type:complete